MEDHALGDPALIDQGDADLGERAQLQVAVLRSPAELMRLPGPGFVLAGIGGVDRLGDQHPAPQWLELMLVDQPRGPRHPPGGGGVVAEVGVVEDAKLDGDEGGLGRVRPLAES